MNPKPLLKYGVALALGSLSSVNLQAASDTALIDILQRKGVLSEKEAESVRKELSQPDGGSAEKIKLNPAVSELKLYGDLRLRYQYDDKDAQLRPSEGGGGNDSQQSRWRFRLRLNADFKLGSAFFGGVELQSGQASDSANQTFENGFNDYNIFISKAFLSWNAADWFTITGGKASNPFYTTDLVWDPDINPTGAYEVFAFHKLFEAPPEESGFSKDGKAVKAASAPALPWELSLVAGQFIFDDNRESGGPDNDSSTDAYLFETQLIGSYKFGGAKVTFAPGYLTYINGALSDVDNSNPFNDPIAGLGGTRNLSLLLAPGDVTFKVAGLKTKIFWDFSYNIDGDERVTEIYGLIGGGPQQTHSSQDDFAYLAGIQLGENKKAGDWSLLANWRQTGLGAVDPNLNDSDFAQGELNTRGVKTSLAYNFTDFAIGALTYQYAWNLRDDLTGGQVTGGAAVGDSNVISVLQVDFSVKF